MDQSDRREEFTPPVGSTAPGYGGGTAASGYDARGAGTGSVSAVAKADIVKRIVAGIIDAVIGALVGLIPLVGGIVAGAYWLFRDGFEFDFMDRRSIGKKVMKLRPVRLDGAPMDLAASARRNWMFALGGVIAILVWIPIIGWLLILPVALIALGIGIVEVVLVLTDAEGRRLGDRTGNTKVIEVSE